MQIGGELDQTNESLTILLNREVLRYSEGSLEILNHTAVERIACRCFWLAKEAITPTERDPTKEPTPSLFVTC